MLDDGERRMDAMLSEITDLRDELDELRQRFDALVTCLDEDSAGNDLRLPATSQPLQYQLLRERPLIQQVELTSKLHKGQMLAGVAIGLLGVFLAFASMVSASPQFMTAAFFVILFGGVLFIAARLSAWWNHG